MVGGYVIQSFHKWFYKVLVSIFKIHCWNMIHNSVHKAFIIRLKQGRITSHRKHRKGFLNIRSTNWYFPRFKGVKKPHFGPYQLSRDILGFDQYLGVTITTSLPLPQHRFVLPRSHLLSHFYTMASIHSECPGKCSTEANLHLNFCKRCNGIWSFLLFVLMEYSSWLSHLVALGNGV